MAISKINTNSIAPSQTLVTPVISGLMDLQGGQIKFPSSQLPSSDANTLDDYEEGTWTPTIASTGTQPTVSSYETRSGFYTKVGNVVTVHCAIRATVSNAGTGNPQVTGLPFTSMGGYPAPALGLRNLLTGTPTPYLSGTTMYLDGGTLITATNNYIAFSVTYQMA